MHRDWCGDVDASAFTFRWVLGFGMFTPPLSGLISDNIPLENSIFDSFRGKVVSFVFHAVTSCVGIFWYLLFNFYLVVLRRLGQTCTQVHHAFG